MPNFLKHFFYNAFFSQSTPLIRLSKKKVISEDDFLVLPKNLEPGYILTKNKLDWNKRPLWFLLSLIPIYRERTFKAYTFFTLALICSLVSPNLIHIFIERLSNHADLTGNLIAGLALAFSGIMIGLFFQHYYYNHLATYQLITNDLNEIIFSQSLHLSLQSRGQSQVGDIVNHMSSDSDSIADFTAIWGDLVWAIITIIGVSGMLFLYIGWSALAALAVMAALAPMTKIIAKRFIYFEEKLRSERDSRVTLINQVLNAMRVVKFFSWERAVSNEINGIRNAELDSRQRLAKAEVLSGASYLAVGTVVLFVALIVHVWRGNTLDAAMLFTCLSLFALLEEPFGQLSRLFSRIGQAIVAVQRLKKFLELDVVKNEIGFLDNSQNLSLKLHKVDFYHSTPQESVLKNISLEIKSGEAIAIVGSVGSGKSSLLYGLLGECRTSAGTIQRKNASGPWAYVPQEAYIINSSLLENLKFGSNLATKEFFRKCVHAACLDKDIRDLPAGFKTEIGEKGVNLSGGQKQRVSLARAALVEPEVILLDDPLSAVDVETERMICERLLFGLWKDKTRIVVTHRLESLDQFDRVLFLKDGQITAQGSFSEMLSNSQEFAEFYSEHKRQAEKSQATRAVAETIGSGEEKTESRITEDEEREKGAVKSGVYRDYILSLGGSGAQKYWILATLALGAIAATSLPLLQKWWLSFYSTHQSEWSAYQGVWIYGGLGVCVLVGSLTNQMFWLSRGIAAGKDMHERMLQSLLKAPIRFFDSTPVGRILQRFSRDIESVDIYLQWSFESFIHCLLQVLVSLVLILVVMPAMVIVILPSLWMYYHLQNNYRRPAREAKRLDSIARSPRYAHFKETLMGLVVIRAFNKQEWFKSEFFVRLRHSQRMFYGHYMFNRWFSSRVPLVGGVISLSTIVAVVLSVQSNWITAGTAGLLTIYSMSFWGQLNWSIRIFADIESRMTSVERLKFYSSIEPEGKGEMFLPQESWPKSGELKCSDVRARYAPHLPLVLQGVSFQVAPGQKVGIIGRTGSGKSTLFQTFYRFVEIEHGKIELDGIDISTVPLERLRRSLAIVPQDPTLFLGTLRSNLDRYNEYTDEDVWTALSKTGLKPYVKGLPRQLQSPVVESGSNLSQGQRQLLCLARALLLNAKVIFMDEATASVDVQTDALIQKVIRESLAETTMVIIAHRLGTVADCDQIIEMADGKVSSVLKKDQLRGQQAKLKALVFETEG